MSSARLISDRYGKRDVRLSKIVRHGDRNDFVELTVATLLEGDFETAHTDGDNSNVIATDTQRNTIYALASQHEVTPIEGFARTLVDHFMEFDQVDQATATVQQHMWHRMTTADGGEHPTSFVRGSSERRVARVRRGDVGEPSVSAGISDLVVLKTASSAFTGYPKTKYTTLPETTDRIFCTSMTADWSYGSFDVDFEAVFAGIRKTLIAVFADHESASVQQTLYDMGAAVIEAFPDVERIHMVMPNVHHIPFDLTPLGHENRNEIFVSTTEPAGLIEATVGRG